MSTAVARIIHELRDRGGLQGKDIANIVDVSPATVFRWSQGKATPELRKQTIIGDLRYVVERLRDFTRRTKSGCGCIHATVARRRTHHRSDQ